MPNATCAYTTVISMYPTEHVFGYLGKHGKRLGAFEQYSEPGDLVQKLASSPRKLNSLLAGLQAGRLAIVRTPAAHVYDSTLGKTQVVSYDNGSLAAADPCWGTYLSALGATFTAIPDGSSAVASATLTFTSPLRTPITKANLVLTRGGSPVTLTGVTVTTSDNKVFTIGGLTSLTGTNGAYIIKLDHTTMTGIVDIFGNAKTTDASEGWTKS